MAALVTLQQAKDQLRVTSEEEDEDISRKIDQASAAVIDWVDNTTLTDGWDEDTVPEQARAATLELILWLFERDTTINAKNATDDNLPPRVIMFLKRLRKPALA